ncbi:Modification methylase BspRI [compost metagenome]
MHEIIVDNFAGGGGASTGIELATGRSVDIAINHDPAAIAMHEENHPDTEHYCESVWDVNPIEATRGRPVALAWFSPDCKHFSKAKGGKPVEKTIRGLAWVAVRWAATVKPRVIMLENVEEFQTWGPIGEDGRPCPMQKGRTFRSFVNALKRLGYEVDWRELVASDYGAPTIRKRFFLIARSDGKKIEWPKPSHAEPGTIREQTGKAKPWKSAAEIIDWSLPVPSIFERKKKLSPNTMRRIARGIYKFIINDPNPFVAPTDAKANDNSEMVTAFLAQYHTETASAEVRGQSLDRPIMTLDTSNRYALVVANLIKHYGGNYTGAGNSLNEPLSTITTVDHNALVVSFLIAYYGSSVGHSLNGPLGTVTTHDRFGLVNVYGQDYQIIDIGMRMLVPHELFPAQGFPRNYIIDRDANGKYYPKTAQVARCGNAVPPPFATALVKANLPEMCVGSGQQLAIERYKPAAGQLAFSL